MTIADAINNGAVLLRQKNIANPFLDSRLIISKILGISAEHVIDKAAVVGDAQGLANNGAGYIVDDCSYQKFLEVLERRASGVCTAYILGHKEFRYLDLIVTPDVLVPQPDTETLVEHALFYIDCRSKSGSNTKVVDLCCGSGAIGLSILYERKKLVEQNMLEVYASDISAAALEITKQNACKYNLPLNVFQSDLFSQFSQFEVLEMVSGTKSVPKFDMIVSNAPYIKTDVIKTLPKEVQNEPFIALDGGADGLDLIRKIIILGKDFLNEGGTLLLEASPDQMGQISACMLENAYSGIKVFKDLGGDDRVIAGGITHFL
ncbi:MAG: peptide chain release factor N(5)-glutamine methyltransferase [Termitinemataceae bacterium]|nr:MAG: peptide chain release factor N(5)-glutamine methyltransferase [Termitinemataceae bacterium]